jgi:hypothetical protein
MKRIALCLWLGCLPILFATPALSENPNPTAFALIEEGNKHVGESARGRIVEIRSERSIGSLNPNIWYIVYYDPTATFKATEVKMGAGKMMTVKRPPRLLEPITGRDKALDREKLKIDSDRALEIALKEPLLEHLQLKSAQYWLERSDDEPVWKIRFWAAKVRQPQNVADVGDVYVSAEDGKVTRTNLHPNRVH